MSTSSVLVGSRPAIPATTLAVTANAVPENLAWTQRDAYLDHPTAALSIVDTLTTLLNTHSELADASVFITRSGRIRMTSSVAFSVTSWGSDNTLRDLLGATGTLASATSHSMTNLSPLIWVPHKPDSSLARVNSDGILVTDTYAGRSGPGQVVATTNNTWRRNTFSWNYVDVAYVETVPDTYGTWAAWWNECVRTYRRFNVYRDVTTDVSDSSTAMSLAGTRLPSALTYIARADGPMERAHNRQVDRLERFCSVSLEVETAAEYS